MDDPPRRVGSRVAAHSGQDRPWICDLSLAHLGRRCAVSRVTPSDACGLGRSASSAKGWVLAMLAREGELRRGSGPAQERAFLSGRLCPAKKTAPEGAD